MIKNSERIYTLTQLKWNYAKWKSKDVAKISNTTKEMQTICNQGILTPIDYRILVFPSFLVFYSIFYHNQVTVVY